MLRFHAIGDWGEGDVVARWSSHSTRRSTPEIDSSIDAAWQAATTRPGVHLFDGPMCRLEAWRTSGPTLELELAPTRYKVFLGTNLANSQFNDQYGPDVMANPIGVSALVETADGILLLGRRNATVAYYPSRIHPFAGALEPRDGVNVFDAVRRELAEELRLVPSDIASVRCEGLVEDLALRQPELLFHVHCSLEERRIESQLDREEHHATFRIPATQDAVESALTNPELTPVATGTLLLWGRKHLGIPWFHRFRATALAKPSG